MALSTAFVYGTLQYPQVLQALISRVPRMEPAVIRGYQRHSIRGQVGQGRVNDVQRSVAVRMPGEVLPSDTTARGGFMQFQGLTPCLDLWSRAHLLPARPRCSRAQCRQQRTRASAAWCCSTCSLQRWRCGRRDGKKGCAGMPCQAALQPLQPGAITQAAQESCGLPPFHPGFGRI